MKPAGPVRVERPLATILAAVAAGYLRLSKVDDEGTLGRHKVSRAEVPFEYRRAWRPDCAKTTPKRRYVLGAAAARSRLH